MARRSRKCPRCGETGLPIVYGYPYPEDFEAAKRGLLVLGGDDLTDNMPTWYCGKDDYGWDGPDPARVIREVLRTVSADPHRSHP